MNVKDNFTRSFRKYSNTLPTFEYKKRITPNIRCRAVTFSHGLKAHSQEENAQERVRNFDLSPTGIQNRGDSFRSKGLRFRSLGQKFRKDQVDASANGRSSLDKKTPQYYPKNIANRTDGEIDEDFFRPICHSIDSKYASYRIKVMGNEHVGKSMLISQMATSDYIDLKDDHDFSDTCMTIPVVLDNQESIMEVEEVQFYQNYKRNVNADGFIMMYSVSDKKSFKYILKKIAYLRDNLGVDRPIILVANKVDLTRIRIIPSQDGRDAADKFKCKYIETSITLRINIDELLVALVRQIRLKLDPKVILEDREKRKECLKRGKNSPKTFFQRLFRRISKVFRRNSGHNDACENIYDL